MKSMSLKILLRMYFLTDEGFDGEGVFLAQEELKRRGYLFSSNGAIIGIKKKG